MKVGDKVQGTNMFKLVYVVTEIDSDDVTVEYRTGEKIMWGGKWIDEVFEYQSKIRDLTLVE